MCVRATFLWCSRLQQSFPGRCVKISQSKQRDRCESSPTNFISVNLWSFCEKCVVLLVYFIGILTIVEYNAHRKLLSVRNEVLSLWKNIKWCLNVASVPVCKILVNMCVVSKYVLIRKSQNFVIQCQISVLLGTKLRFWTHLCFQEVWHW
jgi:hypothetical protein